MPFAVTSMLESVVCALDTPYLFCPGRKPPERAVQWLPHPYPTVIQKRIVRGTRGGRVNAPQLADGVEDDIEREHHNGERDDRKLEDDEHHVVVDQVVVWDLDLHG
jgi:hypothetical protein